jgi:hypothetical protein
VRTPAHNGEPLPANGAAGNAVGSPLPRRRGRRGDGPVTTDPFGVTLRSCQTLPIGLAMTNLRPGRYAGSRAGLVDLPSYISGYVDGEGCFTVSIAPRPTLLVRWEVRPSLSVSQNGDRSEVLLEI